jgi:hypothetical protein
LARLQLSAPSTISQLIERRAVANALRNVLN